MTTTTHFRESHHPTHDEIAKRAYAIYLAEGKPAGRAEEHWRRAEKELRLPIEPSLLAQPKSRAKSDGRVAVASR